MVMYLDNSRIFNIFVLCGVFILILTILVGYNFYKIYKTSNVVEESINTQLLYLAKNQNNIARLNEYVEEEDNFIYDTLEPKIEANRRLINSKMNSIDGVKSKVNSNKKLIDTNIDNIKINKDLLASQQDISDKYIIDQADIIKNITNNQKVIQSNIATFTYNDFKNIRDRLQDSESNIGNIRSHIVDINSEILPKLEARLNHAGSNISRMDTELEDLDSQFEPINVQFASFSNDVLNKLNSESILSRLNDVDYRSRQNKTKAANNFDKFANYMTTEDTKKKYLSQVDFDDYIGHSGRFLDKKYMKKEDHSEWLETKYEPLYDSVVRLNDNVEHKHMTAKEIEKYYMTKDDLAKTFVELPPDITPTVKNEQELMKKLVEQQVMKKLVQQEDENIV